jgi:hypothetical protein
MLPMIHSIAAARNELRGSADNPGPNGLTQPETVAIVSVFSEAGLSMYAFTSELRAASPPTRL